MNTAQQPPSYTPQIVACTLVIIVLLSLCCVEKGEWCSVGIGREEGQVANFNPYCVHSFPDQDAGNGQVYTIIANKVKLVSVTIKFWHVYGGNINNY